MFDIHASVLNHHDEHDEGLVEQYIAGLMTEFAQSPEARSILEKYGDLDWALAMVEYGINYLGTTPAEMSRSDFDEILFEIFPQKVTVEADLAGQIVDEIRAFWQFVDRAYLLDNAPAILAILNDGGTTRRLHKKLDDPSTFGLAKSVVMLGKKAGYDMSTEEGIAEFMAVFNARVESGELSDLPLGSLPGIGFGDLSSSPDRPTGDALKKKRKERKRQRDAKKRNRKR